MPTPIDTSGGYDAEALYRSLLEQVRAGLAGVPDAAIVGIHSGGAWLAERLAADLGLQKRLGFIDVSFYRDDYAKKGLHPDVKPTRIDFAVDSATILLVDDVLETGRTVRAAINVLFDYGRPQRIMLAALADRGGRELPVAADFAGTQAAVQPGQSLALSRDAAGQLSLTIEDDNA
ncbi:bifunctional pyr operon transcriptional regulator/uracil phosphoribosyltransferase PyrR [Massilia aerilata]|uniref:Bifunctional pyr operon transcriptional regulator/uracil phosphoribosyltransferase PyrR n=1 Tax=Massilia aerilata TaxID=453817 RepID=A0ABW0S414_9BURK